MKAALYGKNASFMEEILKKKGVEIVEKDSPHKDLLICYGGDGALLSGELLYPGVPKMAVRDVETAPYCAKHSLERQVDLLLAGALNTTLLPKLSGKAAGKEFFALNDICIHNKHSFSALRYQVKIDDALYANEIVGDGMVVATVHGSTGYYRSITHGSLRTGIGMAFSNSTDLYNHLVLKEESVIKLRILRGPAEMAFDNYAGTIPLEEGAVAVIRQSEKCAIVRGLDLFMCPECRRIRREQRGTGFENIPF